MKFLSIEKRNIDKAGIVKKWVCIDRHNKFKIPFDLYKECDFIQAGFLRIKEKNLLGFSPLVISKNGCYFIEDIADTFEILKKIKKKRNLL